MLLQFARKSDALMKLLHLMAVALSSLPGAARAAAPQEHVYAHAAVAADHVLASEAGAEMLRRGGNAVDAAVAASFCLSVVRPYSCGIGGGGFMLISIPARGGDGPVAVALDYREVAPGAVGPGYFMGLGDELASRAGPHSVGVPGTVAGLLLVLERFGTLERAAVLEPAIRIAEEGWPADASHVAAAREMSSRLRAAPQLVEAAGILWKELCREGSVRQGDLLRNPEQARALRLISEGGADAYYRGPIAQEIVATLERLGGAMTAADLAAYQPRLLPPVRGHFDRYEVLSMPPPSSGGVAVLQILGIVDRRRADALAPGGGGASVHLLAEASKHAFADRARWLADPDFVEVPVARLLDQAYLDKLAGSIDMARTRPDAESYGSVAPPSEDGGTSHLSVIDGGGMAVACTETINLEFGSMIAVAGFALNDEMDDFTTAPGRPNVFGLVQSERNSPAPGKRPLSSMSPTIVLEQGRAVLVAGASGGPRIISGTVQVILNCLLRGMTPSRAVAAPRQHHQWLPDVLEFEDRWTDAAAIEAAAACGHTVGRRDEVGVVQIVQVLPAGIAAASDPRKGGRPAGY